MSNGRLTVMIDGREALPIRAIPYVTAWKESPDSIVNALARPSTVDCGKGLSIRDRYTLCAYQMFDQGYYEPIPASQWEDRRIALSSLTKGLRADEREGATEENHARWRIGATLSLPDNVFVWLDEFESWYSMTRPMISSEGDKNRLREWQAALERPSPDLEEIDELDAELFQPAGESLCLTAMLPPEIEGRVWRYGCVVVSVANPRDAPHEAPKGRDDEAAAVLAQLPNNEHRAIDAQKTGAADMVDADGSFASATREPSLKEGSNRREAVEKWVAYVAKDRAKEFGTRKDLATEIWRIAERYGYESERRKMTIANILRMLPNGVTGGRGKKTARGANQPGILYGKSESEANWRN